MGKCPKCGEEIKHLTYWENRNNVYDYDGQKYELDTLFSDGKAIYYACPECDIIIFSSEEEAKKFLSKNEKGRGDEK